MSHEAGLAIAVGGGLGTMLGWGLADFFAKKTIDEIGDVITLVWAHVCGAALLLAILLVRLATHPTVSLPHHLTTWVMLAAFGLLQAVVYLLVYRGFGKGQVAILNPIFASYSGIAAVVVAALIGEALTVTRVGLIGLIFSGILLLSVDTELLRIKRLRLTTTPGFREIIIAMLLAVVWTVGWDRFVSGQDWLTYVIVMYGWMTLAIAGIARVQGVKLRVTRPSAWRFLALIGITEAMAYVSLSFGFGRSSHAAIVAIISGAFSVPTVILARLFLRERVNRYQWLGIAAVLLGVSLIALD